MATKENVTAAFAGESKASKKYLAFSKTAKKDGFPQIAKLFRAASEAETIHARSFEKLAIGSCETVNCPDEIYAQAHFRSADKAKATKENLEDAVAGENHEFTKLYPEFINAAQEEDNKRAEFAFKAARAVEKIHFELYSEALKWIENSKDMPPAEIYVCSVCGNTVKVSAPSKCPICGAPKNKFDLVK
jgi:rubrerythrin